VEKNLLRKALDVLDKINAAICALLVFGMLVVVLLQIITRLFGHSFSWTEELSRYIMIWIGILGGSLALRKGEHASVRFLIENLNAKALHIVNIIGLLMILGFLLILMSTGFQVAHKAMAIRSTALEIPMTWPKLAIPVGATLMILETINLLVESVKSLKGNTRRVSL